MSEFYIGQQKWIETKHGKKQLRCRCNEPEAIEKYFRSGSRWSHNDTTAENRCLICNNYPWFYIEED